MGAAAELAGNRAKVAVIKGRGKAGHDLVVEAEEEEVNTAKEKAHRKPRRKSTLCQGRNFV